MIDTPMRPLRLLACLLALFGGLPAAVAAAPPFAEGAGAQALTFSVVRNGEVIGTHALAFNRHGGTVEVAIDISIKVKALMVTAYHFEQHGTEIWEGERFKSLSVTTDDDGERHQVAAEPTATGLKVSADGQVAEISPMAIATLWRVQPPQSEWLLDPSDGKPSKVMVADTGEETITVRGKPTAARHWVWDGELKRDLWYDGSGVLVQARFKGDDGSDIFYVLR